ncbi:tyrosine-protein phosphatase [Microbacterium sp. CFBP9034]|uniref:tyrosine-protein phosphatase n=1 Tax=Microbacterium sp. CFBP9034 TaxID=3096540 RepID=UPI002A6B3D87|nr:tyrosine-protein phosphatase [Microbacterium sp. CFBP9034]MDY0908733.1 tyrosine-protein phosphatase [Microbacterium sp. CFBP9034]
MIEGLQNFRDTGGTPLTGGGSTRSGVLYRSEALTALTPAGLSALASTDIGVIADFRTSAERGMAADRLPDTRAFRIVELPLLEGALTGAAQQAAAAPDPAAASAAIAAALAQLPGLGDLYVSMLGQGAASFAELARLVAAATDDPPTAVLVHCTAGKDRTGVAIALLLDAVGADRAAVVADYSSSAANLAGPWADRMRAMVTAMGVPLTPTVDELLTGTPAEAIEQALAWTDERGGAASYLQSGGLTDDELDGLRARLAA